MKKEREYIREGIENLFDRERLNLLDRIPTLDTSNDILKWCGASDEITLLYNKVTKFLDNFDYYAEVFDDGKTD